MVHMSNNKKPVEYYVDESNWPSTLEEAKQFAREALEAWAYKDKVPQFLEEVDKATSILRVQKIVVYPLLSGEGLGVI